MRSTLEFGSDDYLTAFAAPETVFRPRRYINKMVEQMSRAMTRGQRAAFQAQGGAGYVYKLLPEKILATDIEKPVGGEALIDYLHLLQCDKEAGMEDIPHNPAKTAVGRLAERLIPMLARDRAFRERWQRAQRLNALRWQLEARAYAAMLHSLHQADGHSFEDAVERMFKTYIG